MSEPKSGGLLRTVRFLHDSYVDLFMEIPMRDLVNNTLLACVVAAAVLAPTAAFALAPVPVPEPGAIGLVALAAAAGVVAYRLRRRK